MKCSNCGEKVVLRPITRMVNGKKKILWKNFLLMDLLSFLYFISIIIILVAYKYDTQNYEMIYSDPCGFANESGCFRAYCPVSTYGQGVVRVPEVVVPAIG